MAPVEFEKNLRERLRDRKITPAADSWDRIASQLGPEPKRKQAIIKPWMYAVAAAVVLFLALRTVLFQGAELPPTQEVVVSPDTEKQSEDAETKTTPSATENESESESAEEPKTRILVTPEVEKKREEIIYGGIEPETTKEEGLALESGNSGILQDSILMNQRIDREIDSLLTRLAVLESDGEQISDATIDSLLREAELSLANTPKINNTGTVDASALLSEVEVELDRTFREEIFNQLKSRFTRVRLAKAQRNQ